MSLANIEFQDGPSCPVEYLPHNLIEKKMNQGKREVT